MVSNGTLVRRRRDCPAPSAPMLCALANVTLFRRNKSPMIYQYTPPTVPRRVFGGPCCPHDHDPRLFNTPTGGRIRSHKPRCGALWREAGATKLHGRSNQKKNSATTRAHGCGLHIFQDLSNCGSEPCSNGKKAWRFRYLPTCLPSQLTGPTGPNGLVRHWAARGIAYTDFDMSFEQPRTAV